MSTLRQNVSGQRVFFVLVNATTGAGLTGATVTVNRGIDGGAQAAATGTVTELGVGQYRFDPSQADTNGDHVGYIFTATNAVPVGANFVTTNANPHDGTSYGLTAVASNVVQISGDSAAADALETMLDGSGGNVLTLAQLRINSTAAGGAVDIDNSTGPGISCQSNGTHGADFQSNAGNGNGVSMSGNGSGHGLVCAGGMSSGAGIVAIALAGAAPGLAAFGVGDNPGIAATGGATGNGITAAAGTDAHGFQATGEGAGNGIDTTSNGTGAGVRAVGGITGAGGPGLLIAGGGSAGNGMQATANGTGSAVHLIGGTSGHGIHTSGGATTGNGIRVTAMAGNSAGVLIAGQGSAPGISTTGGSTGHGLACVGGATSGDGINTTGGGAGDGIEAVGTGGGFDINADIQGNLSGSVGSVAANGITASSLDATAIAEIADGVWDELIAGHLSAGSTGEALNNATAPTAAVVAAAVWDEPLAGHVIAGTAGKVLSDTGTNVGTILSDTNDIQTRLPATLSGGRMRSQVEGIDAGAITAASIATDAIDGDALAATAVTEIVNGVWDELISLHLLSGSTGEALNNAASGSSPGAIADAVWDELRAGHVIAGSFGEGVASVQGNVTGSVGSVTGNVTGSVGSVAANGITASSLDATAIAEIADGVWDEDIVAAHGTADTSGLILSQLTRRTVTFNTAVVDGSVFGQIADDGTATYDRTTDSLQAIRDALAAAGPSAGVIADAVWDELRAGHVIAGSFGEGVASVQGNVTGSVASVTGNVAGSVGSVTGNVGGNVTGSVGSIAAGGITSASFAANSITSGALATSAVDEIVDGVWDELIAGHLGVGSTGEALNNAGSGASAAVIADAVWDELRAGHVAAGSFGEYVLADMVRVSGDAAAADAFETMLDGTGGNKLTLEQLRINSTTAGGAIDLDNSAGPAISASTSSGVAVEFVSTGGNGSGLAVTGQGSGHGMIAQGGATNGDGINAAGGATDGRGIVATGAGAGAGLRTVGGATGHGAHFIGVSTGSGLVAAGGASAGTGIVANAGGGNAAGFSALGTGTGAGMAAQGGGTNGAGFAATGGATNSHGIIGMGAGTGSGIRGNGGLTGHGFHGFAGATSGDGFRVQANTNGHGFQGIGGNTAGNSGIVGQSGVSGHGFYGFGDGAGAGMRLEAGATGHGLDCVGGATSGDGVHAIAPTAGDGMELVGAGGGFDLNADIQGSLSGSVGSVTGSVGSVVGNVGGNVTGSVGSIAAGGITSASFAAGSITAAATDSTFTTEIEDTVWDATLANHLDPGSTGEALDNASTGGGGTDWTGGERDQIRQALGITGTTAATTGTGTLEVAIAGVQSDTNDIQTRLPASLSGGRMRSQVEGIDAGAITAASIATDAIDSDAIAPSAVTEIQAGLATSAAVAAIQADTDDLQTRLPLTLSGGRMRSQVEGLDANTITAAALDTSAVNEIVDQVWDELLAGHLGVGSTGEALNNAGSGASAAVIAAAVWDEPRAGHVTAGTFGQGVASVQGNVTGSVGSIAAGGLTAASTDLTFATEIEDTVWDAVLANHLDVGSTGEALSNAGSVPATDWTANERAQIRQALGVTGATLATTGTGTLEVLDASILAAIATAQIDLDNLQTRLPTTLNGGRMRSHVEACDPPCTPTGGGGGGAPVDTFEGVPL